MNRVDNGAHPKTFLNNTVVIRQLVNFALTRRLIDRDPLAAGPEGPSAHISA
jgi:hypothetical protein